jgi:hypothetical protein
VSLRLTSRNTIGGDLGEYVRLYTSCEFRKDGLHALPSYVPDEAPDEEPQPEQADALGDLPF